MESWRQELYTNELWHHGIKGQQWGERNGPPYPLDAATHNAVTKQQLKDKRRKEVVTRTWKELGIVAGGTGAMLGSVAISVLIGNPAPLIAGYLALGASYVGAAVHSANSAVTIRELDQEIKAMEEGEKMAEAFLKTKLI